MCHRIPSASEAASSPARSISTRTFRRAHAKPSSRLFYKPYFCGVGELASAPWCALLAAHGFDAAQLRRLGSRLPAPVVWPNAVDLTFYAGVREQTVTFPTGLARNGATIIFVGLYSYWPNRAAAEELLEQVVPHVFKRMPGARFLFVGGSPTPEMLRAAQDDPRIVVTGKVDDIRQYLALDDVCIVPIRTGGGTRAKILECFASKIPVVSTAKGAEGIDAVPGREIRFAEVAASLADNALDLLNDKDASLKQAEAASNSYAVCIRGIA